eukprot:1421096-Amphidinium_carterae.1
MPEGNPCASLTQDALPQWSGEVGTKFTVVAAHIYSSVCDCHVTCISGFAQTAQTCAAHCNLATDRLLHRQLSSSPSSCIPRHSHCSTARSPGCDSAGSTGSQNVRLSTACIVSMAWTQGLVAIQYAIFVGAEVFATAGSEDQQTP